MFILQVLGEKGVWQMKNVNFTHNNGVNQLRGVGLVVKWQALDLEVPGRDPLVPLEIGKWKFLYKWFLSPKVFFLFLQFFYIKNKLPVEIHKIMTKFWEWYILLDSNMKLHNLS